MEVPMADTLSDEISEIAKLDFEPWQHSENEWTPPSNDKWTELANPHLIHTRVAWISMYKSKAELVETIRKLEEAEIAEELLTGIADSQSFFQGYVELLKGAEARLFAAACALAAEGGSKSASGASDVSAH
jgi:hypothetical protein